MPPLYLHRPFLSFVRTLGIWVLLSSLLTLVVAENASVIAEADYPSWAKSQSITFQLTITSNATTKHLYSAVPLSTAKGANDTSPSGKRVRRLISLDGDMFLANVTNFAQVPTDDDNIIYLSCDADEKNPQNPTPNIMLNSIMEQKPYVILLYSLANNFCFLEGGEAIKYQSVFTMTNKDQAGKVLGFAGSPAANVTGLLSGSLPSANDDSSSGNNDDNSSTADQNGDSNKDSSDKKDDNSDGNNDTADLNSPPKYSSIAMTVLYSITAFVTFLFITIIVTGAIRAHRYPERYGPRSGLGTLPPQSRARGLARAVLETLPIVKFGDNTNKNSQQTTGGSENPTNSRDGDATRSSTEDLEMQNHPTHPTIPVDPNTDQPIGAESTETRNLGQTESNTTPLTSTHGETAGRNATTTSGATREITPTENLAQPSSLVSPSTSTALGATTTVAAAPHASSNDSSSEEDPLATACCICTDDFHLGEDVRVLPCTHQFHPACVDPWLIDVSATCPLCRMDLQPSGEHDHDHSDAEDGGTMVDDRDGQRREHGLTFFGRRRQRRSPHRRANANEAENDDSISSSSAPSAHDRASHHRVSAMIRGRFNRMTNDDVQRLRNAEASERLQILSEMGTENRGRWQFGSNTGGSGSTSSRPELSQGVDSLPAVDSTNPHGGVSATAPNDNTSNNSNGNHGNRRSFLFNFRNSRHE